MRECLAFQLIVCRGCYLLSTAVLEKEVPFDMPQYFVRRGVCARRDLFHDTRGVVHDITRRTLEQAACEGSRVAAQSELKIERFSSAVAALS